MALLRDRSARKNSHYVDLLGTSYTSNASDLDVEEELREEDVWGANDSDEGVQEQQNSADREQDRRTGKAIISGQQGGRRLGFGAVGGSTVAGLTSDFGAGMSMIGNGKTSTTPSRMIPTTSSSYVNASHPMRRQSAPVNVPDWSKVMGVNSRKPLKIEDPKEVEDDDGGPMIPPHEIMAREYSQSVTFSVYEGVGRTLRGRDLNSVRTAVLRKTGFLDS